MSVVRKTLFAVTLMASGAAYAGTPGWSVSEASGPVFVHKPGVSKTSAIARGAALSAGDVISTGKGGRAIIVRGGEYLTVAPNTQVQLTEPKAGAFTQIVQSFGNVVFKIQKKTTPHFQVNTPYLAAVVKGTTFSVTVTPAGTSVQVTEGLVQIQSLDGNAMRFVSPGEIGMISAAAPGQLSVLGTPSAPSGAPTVVGAAPAAPVDAASSDAPSEPVAPPVSEIAEVRIASPIGEGNVNLAAQTGGMVSGNSSLTSAAVIDAVTTVTAAEQPTVIAETAVATPDVPAPVATDTQPEPAPPAPAAVETAPAAPPAAEAASQPTPVAVAEAAPVETPAPLVEAPAQVVVAEVTPSLPPQAAPAAVESARPVSPVAISEVAPVETPATPVEAPAQVVVAEATPSLPPQAAPAAVENASPVAASAPPAAPTETPTLVSVADTAPSLPSQAAPAAVENANLPSNAGTGSSKGNGSSGSSHGKNFGKKGEDQIKSLAELLKALQEAAKQASLQKKGS